MIDKYNAKAYFMKGMNYKDLKDTAKAISSMQTAVEQDQQYYNAYMQLGLLTAAQKNPLAIQYYKNAIRIQSKSTEAWYALGKFYQDIADWNTALATYTTLLQFNNDKYTHYNMGVIYFEKMKKPDLAINHFSEAIKLDPNYVEAYYARGFIYQSLHNIKLASEDYQTCLSRNPNYEPAQVALKQLKGGK
jgi:tetratricopeptide (TPR) repeat protein